MKYKLLLIFYTAFILGCDEDPKEPLALHLEVPAQNGEEIFMMYCAQCHGISGDGKSFIELDRPARSFVDGGFSFGNTIEAIAKTTRSGIPGTPMPPFAELLNDNEILLVSQHIRQFAPTLKEVLPSETELVVGTRPAVVRGMIPPIQDGLQLHPRGVLIGNPDGFSYEYRVDDVRLLGIRQGSFVERVDWTERGGSPLKPLGKIVVLVDNGDPSGMFTTEDNKPLRAKLTSTSIALELGVIRYDLVDEHGDIQASVTEICRPTTGVRSLIEQQLVIHADKPLMITTPLSATMNDDKYVPVGKHSRTIIHAAKEQK